MRLLDFRGFVLRVAWTMDYRHGFWLVVYGRGGVLLLGIIMVWWLRDLYEREIAP